MTDSIVIAHSTGFIAEAADAVSEEADATDQILARARERVATTKAGYAGSVTPQEAWELFAAGVGVLVDVRTAEERQFVGRIPDSIHVPFLTGMALQRNPRFVREVETKVGRDQVVLLICRSGSRSTAAAQALSEARFRNAFNVLEGFEGDLNERKQRGSRSGWRFHGLPWVQD